jgi:hypothetical protein
VVRAWIAALSALAIVGLGLTLIGGGTAGAIGLGLIGIAAVGAVSLGFFAVGRSEDRAREAETARREVPRPEPPGGNSRLESRRPPRSRGDA